MGYEVERSVIEAKGGTPSVEESARAAFQDLLAQRAAFAAKLNGVPEPYGLGVAWGAKLEQKMDYGIVLCSPAHIGSALSNLFG